jgi:hypothetical protein
MGAAATGIRHPANGALQHIAPGMETGESDTMSGRDGAGAVGNRYRKDVMRVAVACLFAALCLAGSSRAMSADPQQGDREVTISNQATQAINEIYVSPSRADHWGEDRLGEETLAPGHTLKLKLGPSRDCSFDIQVVYEDASREEAKSVNVCQGRQLAFDGSTATATAPATHEVVIANEADRPIQQVLISPSASGEWGEDRLGNTSISVGDQMTLRYRGDCVADVRVVFDNRAAEERRGIDLCASHRIAIQPGWTTADSVPSDARAAEQPVRLVVTNRTGRKVESLVVFPDKGEPRGPNLLGDNGLEDGASVTVAFARPAGVCRFGARVEFAPGRAAEEMDGLDLCHSRELVLPVTL